MSSVSSTSTTTPWCPLIISLSETLSEQNKKTNELISIWSNRLWPKTVLPPPSTKTNHSGSVTLGFPVAVAPQTAPVIDTITNGGTDSSQFSFSWSSTSSSSSSSNSFYVISAQEISSSTQSTNRMTVIGEEILLVSRFQGNLFSIQSFLSLLQVNRLYQIHLTPLTLDNVPNLSLRQSVPFFNPPVPAPESIYSSPTDPLTIRWTLNAQVSLSSIRAFAFQTASGSESVLQWKNLLPLEHILVSSFSEQVLQSRQFSISIPVSALVRFFRVACIDTNGVIGAYSSVYDVQTQTIPTGIQAMQFHWEEEVQRLRLGWTVDSLTGTDIDTFQLIYQTGMPPMDQVITEQAFTSFPVERDESGRLVFEWILTDWEGVPPGSTITFGLRVKSKLSGFYSSAFLAMFTRPATVPHPPRLVQLRQVNPRQIKVDVSLPFLEDMNGSLVQEVDIRLDALDSFTFPVPSQQWSFLVDSSDDLTCTLENRTFRPFTTVSLPPSPFYIPGLRYALSCRARNGIGWSVWNVAIPLFLIVSPPSAPVLESIEMGDGSAIIMFRPPETLGYGSVRYEIRALSNGDETELPVVTSEQTETEIEYPFLTNGQSYSFVVRAIQLSVLETNDGPYANDFVWWDDQPLSVCRSNPEEVYRPSGPPFIPLESLQVVVSASTSSSIQAVSPTTIESNGSSILSLVLRVEEVDMSGLRTMYEYDISLSHVTDLLSYIVSQGFLFKQGFEYGMSHAWRNTNGISFGFSPRTSLQLYLDLPLDPFTYVHLQWTASLSRLQVQVTNTTPLTTVTLELWSTSSVWTRQIMESRDVSGSSASLEVSEVPPGEPFWVHLIATNRAGSTPSSSLSGPFVTSPLPPLLGSPTVQYFTRDTRRYEVTIPWTTSVSSSLQGVVRMKAIPVSNGSLPVVFTQEQTTTSGSFVFVARENELQWGVRYSFEAVSVVQWKSPEGEVEFEVESSFTSLAQSTPMLVSVYPQAPLVTQLTVGSESVSFEVDHLTSVVETGGSPIQAYHYSLLRQDDSTVVWGPVTLLVSSLSLLSRENSSVLFFRQTVSTPLVRNGTAYTLRVAASSLEGPGVGPDTQTAQGLLIPFTLPAAPFLQLTPSVHIALDSVELSIQLNARNGRPLDRLELFALPLSVSQESSFPWTDPDVVGHVVFFDSQSPINSAVDSYHSYSLPTPYVFTGLVSGRVYRFTGRVWNSLEQSSLLSSPWTEEVRVGEAPGPVQEVQWSSPDSLQVQVQFLPPVDTGISQGWALLGYEFRWTRIVDSVEIALLRIPVEECDPLTGILFDSTRVPFVDGDVLQLSVRAYNAVTSSVQQMALPATLTVYAFAIPSPPLLQAIEYASPAGQDVRIQGLYSANTGLKPLTEYVIRATSDIEQVEFSGPITPSPPPFLSFSHRVGGSLHNGSLYTFEMKVSNAFRSSAWSELTLLPFLVLGQPGLPRFEWDVDNEDDTKAIVTIQPGSTGGYDPSLLTYELQWEDENAITITRLDALRFLVTPISSSSSSLSIRIQGSPANPNLVYPFQPFHFPASPQLDLSSHDNLQALQTLVRVFRESTPLIRRTLFFTVPIPESTPLSQLQVRIRAVCEEDQTETREWIHPLDLALFPLPTSFTLELAEFQRFHVSIESEAWIDSFAGKLVSGLQTPSSELWIRGPPVSPAQVLTPLLLPETSSIQVEWIPALPLASVESYVIRLICPDVPSLHLQETVVPFSSITRHILPVVFPVAPALSLTLLSIQVWSTNTWTIQPSAPTHSVSSVEMLFRPGPLSLFQLQQENGILRDRLVLTWNPPVADAGGIARYLIRLENGERRIELEVDATTGLDRRVEFDYETSALLFGAPVYVYMRSVGLQGLVSEEEMRAIEPVYQPEGVGPLTWVSPLTLSIPSPSPWLREVQVVAFEVDGISREEIHPSLTVHYHPTLSVLEFGSFYPTFGSLPGSVRVRLRFVYEGGYISPLLQISPAVPMEAFQPLPLETPILSLVSNEYGPTITPWTFEWLNLPTLSLTLERDARRLDIYMALHPKHPIQEPAEESAFVRIESQMISTSRIVVQPLENGRPVELFVRLRDTTEAPFFPYTTSNASLRLVFQWNTPRIPAVTDIEYPNTLGIYVRKPILGSFHVPPALSLTPYAQLSFDMEVSFSRTSDPSQVLVRQQTYTLEATDENSSSETICLPFSFAVDSSTTPKVVRSVRVLVRDAFGVSSEEPGWFFNDPFFSLQYNPLTEQDEWWVERLSERTEAGTLQLTDTTTSQLVPLTLTESVWSLGEQSRVYILSGLSATPFAAFLHPYRSYRVSWIGSVSQTQYVSPRLFVYRPSLDSLSFPSPREQNGQVLFQWSLPPAWPDSSFDTLFLEVSSSSSSSVWTPIYQTTQRLNVSYATAVQTFLTQTLIDQAVSGWIYFRIRIQDEFGLSSSVSSMETRAFPLLYPSFRAIGTEPVIQLIPKSNTFEITPHPTLYIPDLQDPAVVHQVFVNGVLLGTGHVFALPLTEEQVGLVSFRFHTVPLLEEDRVGYASNYTDLTVFRPLAPVGVTVSEQLGVLRIQWDAPIDVPPGVLRYRVEAEGDTFSFESEATLELFVEQLLTSLSVETSISWTIRVFAIGPEGVESVSSVPFVYENVGKVQSLTLSVPSWEQVTEPTVHLEWHTQADAFPWARFFRIKAIQSGSEFVLMDNIPWHNTTYHSVVWHLLSLALDVSQPFMLRIEPFCSQRTGIPVYSELYQWTLPSPPTDFTVQWRADDQVYVRVGPGSSSVVIEWKTGDMGVYQSVPSNESVFPVPSGSIFIRALTLSPVPWVFRSTWSTPLSPLTPLLRIEPLSFQIQLTEDGQQIHARWTNPSPFPVDMLDVYHVTLVDVESEEVIRSTLLWIPGTDQSVVFPWTAVGVRTFSLQYTRNGVDKGTPLFQSVWVEPPRVEDIQLVQLGQSEGFLEYTVIPSITNTTVSSVWLQVRFGSLPFQLITSSFLPLQLLQTTTTFTIPFTRLRDVPGYFPGAFLDVQVYGVHSSGTTQLFQEILSFPLLSPPVELLVQRADSLTTRQLRIFFGLDVEAPTTRVRFRVGSTIVLEDELASASTVYEIPVTWFAFDTSYTLECQLYDITSNVESGWISSVPFQLDTLTIPTSIHISFFDETNLVVEWNHVEGAVLYLVSSEGVWLDTVSTTQVTLSSWRTRVLSVDNVSLAVTITPVNTWWILPLVSPPEGTLTTQVIGPVQEFVSLFVAGPGGPVDSLMQLSWTPDALADRYEIAMETWNEDHTILLSSHILDANVLQTLYSAHVFEVWPMEQALSIRFRLQPFQQGNQGPLFLSPFTRIYFLQAPLWNQPLLTQDNGLISLHWTLLDNEGSVELVWGDQPPFQSFHPPIQIQAPLTTISFPASLLLQETGSLRPVLRLRPSTSTGIVGFVSDPLQEKWVGQPSALTSIQPLRTVLSTDNSFVEERLVLTFDTLWSYSTTEATSLSLWVSSLSTRMRLVTWQAHEPYEWNSSLLDGLQEGVEYMVSVQLDSTITGYTGQEVFLVQPWIRRPLALTPEISQVIMLNGNVQVFWDGHLNQDEVAFFHSYVFQYQYRDFSLTTSTSFSEWIVAPPSALLGAGDSSFVWGGVEGFRASIVPSLPVECVIRLRLIKLSNEVGIVPLISQVTSEVDILPTTTPVFQGMVSVDSDAYLFEWNPFQTFSGIPYDYSISLTEVDPELAVSAVSTTLLSVQSSTNSFALTHLLLQLNTWYHLNVQLVHPVTLATGGWISGNDFLHYRLPPPSLSLLSVGSDNQHLSMSVQVIQPLFQQVSTVEIQIALLSDTQTPFVSISKTLIPSVVDMVYLDQNVSELVLASGFTQAEIEQHTVVVRTQAYNEYGIIGAWSGLAYWHPAPIQVLFQPVQEVPMNELWTLQWVDPFPISDPTLWYRVRRADTLEVVKDELPLGGSLVFRKNMLTGDMSLDDSVLFSFSSGSVHSFIIERSSPSSRSSTIDLDLQVVPSATHLTYTIDQGNITFAWTLLSPRVYLQIGTNMDPMDTFFWSSPLLSTTSMVWSDHIAQLLAEEYHLTPAVRLRAKLVPVSSIGYHTGMEAFQEIEFPLLPSIPFVFSIEENLSGLYQLRFTPSEILPPGWTLDIVNVDTNQLIVSSLSDWVVALEAPLFLPNTLYHFKSQTKDPLGNTSKNYLSPTPFRFSATPSVAPTQIIRSTATLPYPGLEWTVQWTDTTLLAGAQLRLEYSVNSSFVVFQTVLLTEQERSNALYTLLLPTFFQDRGIGSTQSVYFRAVLSNEQEMFGVYSASVQLLPALSGLSWRPQEFPMQTLWLDGLDNQTVDMFAESLSDTSMLFQPIQSLSSQTSLSFSLNTVTEALECFSTVFLPGKIYRIWIRRQSGFFAFLDLNLTNASPPVNVTTTVVDGQCVLQWTPVAPNRLVLRSFTVDDPNPDHVLDIFLASGSSFLSIVEFPVLNNGNADLEVQLIPYNAISYRHTLVPVVVSRVVSPVIPPDSVSVSFAFTPDRVMLSHTPLLPEVVVQYGYLDVTNNQTTLLATSEQQVTLLEPGHAYRFFVQTIRQGGETSRKQWSATDWTLPASLLPASSFQVQTDDTNTLLRLDWTHANDPSTSHATLEFAYAPFTTWMPLLTTLTTLSHTLANFVSIHEACAFRITFLFGSVTHAPEFAPVRLLGPSPAGGIQISVIPETSLVLSAVASSTPLTRYDFGVRVESSPLSFLSLLTTTPQLSLPWNQATQTFEHTPSGFSLAAETLPVVFTVRQRALEGLEYSAHAVSSLFQFHLVEAPVSVSSFLLGNLYLVSASSNDSHAVFFRCVWTVSPSILSEPQVVSSMETTPSFLQNGSALYDSLGVPHTTPLYVHVESYDTHRIRGGHNTTLQSPYLFAGPASVTTSVPSGGRHIRVSFSPVHEGVEYTVSWTGSDSTTGTFPPTAQLFLDVNPVLMNWVPGVEYTFSVVALLSFELYTLATSSASFLYEIPARVHVTLHVRQGNTVITEWDAQPFPVTHYTLTYRDDSTQLILVEEEEIALNRFETTILTETNTSVQVIAFHSNGLASEPLSLPLPLALYVAPLTSLTVSETLSEWSVAFELEPPTSAPIELQWTGPTTGSVSGVYPSSPVVLSKATHLFQPGLYTVSARIVVNGLHQSVVRDTLFEMERPIGPLTCQVSVVDGALQIVHATVPFASRYLMTWIGSNETIGSLGSSMDTTRTFRPLEDGEWVQGVFYTFDVVAEIFGVWSTITSASLFRYVTPEAVLPLTHSLQHQTVSTTWSEPTSLIYPVVSYRVTYTDDQPMHTSVSYDTTETQWIIPDLSATLLQVLNVLDVRIVAKNSIGLFGPLSVLPTPAYRLYPPTAFTITDPGPLSSTFVATWQDLLNVDSLYRLEWSTGSMSTSEPGIRSFSLSKTLFQTQTSWTVSLTALYATNESASISTLLDYPDTEGPTSCTSQVLLNGQDVQVEYASVQGASTYELTWSGTNGTSGSMGSQNTLSRIVTPAAEGWVSDVVYTLSVRALVQGRYTLPTTSSVVYSIPEPISTSNITHTWVDTTVTVTWVEPMSSYPLSSYGLIFTDDLGNQATIDSIPSVVSEWSVEASTLSGLQTLTTSLLHVRVIVKNSLGFLGLASTPFVDAYRLESVTNVQIIDRMQPAFLDISWTAPGTEDCLLQWTGPSTDSIRLSARTYALSKSVLPPGLYEFSVSQVRDGSASALTSVFFDVSNAGPLSFTVALHTDGRRFVLTHSSVVDATSYTFSWSGSNGTTGSFSSPESVLTQLFDPVAANWVSGVTYAFTVSAILYGHPSTSRQATPSSIFYQLPAPVVLLSHVLTGTTVTTTWDDPVEPVAYFRLLFADDQGHVATAPLRPGNRRSYTFTLTTLGLSTTSNIEVQIEALNEAGFASSVVTATTLYVFPPSVLETSTVGSNILCTWVDSPEPVSYYQLSWSGPTAGSEQIPFGTNSFSLLWSSFVPGLHVFSLSAVSGMNSSTLQSSIYTVVYPGATLLTVQTNPTHTLTLTHDSVLTASSYTVSWSGSNGTTGSLGSSPANVLTRSLDPIAAGWVADVTYTCSVFAVAYLGYPTQVTESLPFFYTFPSSVFVTTHRIVQGNTLFTEWVIPSFAPTYPVQSYQVMYTNEFDESFSFSVAAPGTTFTISLSQLISQAEWNPLTSVLSVDVQAINSLGLSSQPTLPPPFQTAYRLDAPTAFTSELAPGASTFLFRWDVPNPANTMHSYYLLEWDGPSIGSVQIISSTETTYSALARASLSPGLYTFSLSTVYLNHSSASVTSSLQVLEAGPSFFTTTIQPDGLSVLLSHAAVPMALSYTVEWQQVDAPSTQGALGTTSSTSGLFEPLEHGWISGSTYVFLVYATLPGAIVTEIRSTAPLLYDPLTSPLLPLSHQRNGDILTTTWNAPSTGVIEFYRVLCTDPLGGSSVVDVYDAAPSLFLHRTPASLGLSSTHPISVFLTAFRPSGWASPLASVGSVAYYIRSPIGLQSSLVDTSVVLTWSNPVPANPVGTYYQLTWDGSSTGSDQLNGESISSTIPFAVLAPGVHTFTLSAVYVFAPESFVHSSVEQSATSDIVFAGPDTFNADVRARGYDLLLTHSLIPDATAYIITWKRQDDGTEGTVGTFVSSEWTHVFDPVVAGWVSGRTYTFSVRATVYANGHLTSARPTLPLLYEVPSEIQPVSHRYETGMMVVTQWTNVSFPVLGYRLEYTDGIGGLFETPLLPHPTNTYSASVLGDLLLDGTSSVTVRLAVVNSLGFSSPYPAMGLSAAYLRPPTSLVIQPVGSDLVLSWTHPSPLHEPGKASGYQIEWSGPTTGWDQVDLSVQTISLPLSSLLSGAYTFSVYTVNSSLDSSAPLTNTFTVQFAGPSTLTAVIQSDGYNVLCSHPTVSNAISYTVSWTGSNGTQGSLGSHPTNASRVFDPAGASWVSGVTYTFSVVATLSGNVVTTSTLSTPVVYSLPSLIQPTLHQLQASTVTTTWNEPLFSPSYPLVLYRVLYTDEMGGSFVTTTGSTIRTFSSSVSTLSLQTQSNIMVQVTAFNSLGWASPVPSPTTAFYVRAPTSFQGSISGSSIELSWIQPSPVNVFSSYYLIQWTGPANGSVQVPTNTSLYSTPLSNFVSGNYVFRISTVYVSPNSFVHSSVIQSAPSLTVASAGPSSLTYTVNSLGTHLNMVYTAVPGASSYVLTWSGSNGTSGSRPPVTTLTQLFNLGGFISGVTYTFGVFAMVSGVATSSTFSTPMLFDKPGQVFIDQCVITNSNNLQITWNAPVSTQPISTYTIYLADVLGNNLTLTQSAPRSISRSLNTLSPLSNTSNINVSIEAKNSLGFTGPLTPISTAYYLMAPFNFAVANSGSNIVFTWINNGPYPVDTIHTISASLYGQFYNMNVTNSVEASQITFSVPRGVFVPGSYVFSLQTTYVSPLVGYENTSTIRSSAFVIN